MTKLPALFVPLLAIIACTTALPSVPAGPAHPGPDLVVHVVASGSAPEMGLSGVEVTAITGTGALVPYGKTFGGNIRLAKSRLEADQAAVLLFCHPVFQCGARRVREDHLLEYDEIWIDLAPMVLR